MRMDKRMKRFETETKVVPASLRDASAMADDAIVRCRDPN